MSMSMKTIKIKYRIAASVNCGCMNINIFYLLHAMSQLRNYVQQQKVARCARRNIVFVHCSVNIFKTISFLILIRLLYLYFCFYSFYTQSQHQKLLITIRIILELSGFSFLTWMEINAM